MTVTLKAGDFRQLVSTVIPFADDSRQAFPVIEAVQLRVVGGHLVATATDRYRLGSARQAIEADGTLPDVLVPAKLLRSALPVIAGRARVKGFDTAVSLEVVDDGLRITSTGGLFDAAITLPITQGEYPKVETLITKALAATPSGSTRVGLTARYLASFSHVTRGGDVLVVTTSDQQNTPLLVTAGDYFVGLLMRCYLRPPATDEVPDWTAIYPAAKTTETTKTTKTTKTTEKDETAA